MNPAPVITTYLRSDCDVGVHILLSGIMTSQLTGCLTYDTHCLHIHQILAMKMST